ncbi:MAG: hypothetical protein JKY50_00850 [Oleispira sp.]|nr:hypothetical protein [Oleispira sp.]
MALFQPFDPARLVDQQFFAPETKFNVLGGIQQVIEEGRAGAADRQLQGAVTASVQGTATPDQIGLMFKNDPAKALKVLEGVGVRNQQQASRVAQAAFSIRSAPIDQRPALIQQAAAQIQQVGGDPNRILSMLNMGEEEQNELASVFEQAALSVTQRTADALDQSKLGLEERRVAATESNVASQNAARRLVAGQKGAQLDFDKEKLEVRKLEQEETALNNQIKQETNALKRDELRLKVNEKAAQIEQKKLDTQFTIDSSIASIEDTILTTERLLEGEGLEKAAGISSAFFTTPGSEAANFEALLDTFKSQQFIQEVDKMRGLGALGEKEGQKLIDSAGSLNLGMSDKVLRKEINRIQAKLRQARTRIQKKFRVQPKEAPDNKGTATISNASPGVALGDLTPADIANMSIEELKRRSGQ